MDTTKRLGCLPGGAADVRAHCWFRSVDWAAAAAGQLVPPFRHASIPRLLQLRQIHTIPWSRSFNLPACILHRFSACHCKLPCFSYMTELTTLNSRSPCRIAITCLMVRHAHMLKVPCRCSSKKVGSHL